MKRRILEMKRTGRKGKAGWMSGVSAVLLCTTGILTGLCYEPSVLAWYAEQISGQPEDGRIDRIRFAHSETGEAGELCCHRYDGNGGCRILVYEGTQGMDGCYIRVGAKRREIRYARCPHTSSEGERTGRKKHRPTKEPPEAAEQEEHEH